MYAINNNVSYEIIINKSRFICYLIKVYNEDDVKINLNKIKSTHKDANHYCYSYIIDNVKRFNDDGEPNGTAGLPMLNSLENNNLNYILAIVVRYFGGIKLGAGGLVRAYSKSVSETISKVNLNLLQNGKEITITFNYDKVNFFDSLLKTYNIKNKVFNELIEYTFDISDEDFNNIKDALHNNSNKIIITNDIVIEKK